MTVKGVYHALPFSARKWLRSHLFAEHIDEIHVERIQSTKKQLFHWLTNHPETMLMPTFSYELPLTQTLISLYRDLLNAFPEHPTGLHVHVSGGLYGPQDALPDYQTQKECITEGLEALTKLGVKIADFAAGHWDYNYNTFLICRELGLVNVHVKLKEIPRLTYEYGLPIGLHLVPVVRHIHDYDI